MCTCAVVRAKTLKEESEDWLCAERALSPSMCVHSSLIRVARMQTMREGEQRRVLWPPPVLEVAEVPAEGLVVEKPGLGKVCSAGTAWVIYGCEAGGGTRRAHGASSLDWRAFARTRARPRAERWKPRYELTSARGKVLASPERSLSRQICLCTKRKRIWKRRRTTLGTGLGTGLARTGTNTEKGNAQRFQRLLCTLSALARFGLLHRPK